MRSLIRYFIRGTLFLLVWSFASASVWADFMDEDDSSSPSSVQTAKSKIVFQSTPMESRDHTETSASEDEIRQDIEQGVQKLSSTAYVESLLSYGLKKKSHTDYADLGVFSSDLIVKRKQGVRFNLEMSLVFQQPGGERIVENRVFDFEETGEGVLFLDEDMKSFRETFFHRVYEAIVKLPALPEGFQEAFPPYFEVFITDLLKHSEDLLIQITRRFSDEEEGWRMTWQKKYGLASTAHPKTESPDASDAANETDQEEPLDETDDFFAQDRLSESSAATVPETVVSEQTVIPVEADKTEEAADAVTMPDQKTDLAVSSLQPARLAEEASEDPLPLEGENPSGGAGDSGALSAPPAEIFPNDAPETASQNPETEEESFDELFSETAEPETPAEPQPESNPEPEPPAAAVPVQEDQGAVIPQETAVIKTERPFQAEVKEEKEAEAEKDIWKPLERKPEMPAASTEPLPETVEQKAEEEKIPAVKTVPASPAAVPEAKTSIAEKQAPEESSQKQLTDVGNFQSKTEFDLPLRTYELLMAKRDKLEEDDKDFVTISKEMWDAKHKLVDLGFYKLHPKKRKQIQDDVRKQLNL